MVTGGGVQSRINLLSHEPRGGLAPRTTYHG